MTSSDRPARCETLVELLTRRAAEDPTRLQYRFLDGSSPVEATVDDVHQLAGGVGTALATRHEPGQRVLLLLQTGESFVGGFFGSLYAGLVPVPVAPPGRARLSRSLIPVRTIADDCEPSAVVTTRALATTVRDALDEGDPLRRPVWHAIEDLAGGEPLAPGPARESTPGDVAYIQYTSGSTSAPKGVLLTHGAVCANLDAINTAFDNRPSDSAVFWLPLHHDMGLVGGLLAPLATAGAMTYASATRFVQSPVRWLRWMSDYGATISGGPDFAYRLCVDRVRDDQLDGIDLSQWRLAFTGAEPISADTITAFTERFGPYGFPPTAFYPCYGLAEATLLVTGGDAHAAPATVDVSRRALETSGVEEAKGRDDDRRTLVGCGTTIGSDDEVVIVDPQERRRQPDRTVGEIWYRGPSLAAGYHGRSTDEPAFDAELTDGTGGFLRTGDTGFLDDGELYVTGRMKDVIIVRGRNLDAHDIETRVAAALDGTRLGMTVALSSLRTGVERLVLLQEVSRSDLERRQDLEAAIQRELASTFGVRADDVAFLLNGSLPRTTSGKPRRADTAALYDAGDLPIT